MFRILVRRLDTETYEEPTAVRYRTREKAERALRLMLVQVRSGGDYIPPEEFEVVKTAEKTDSSPLRDAGSE